MATCFIIFFLTIKSVQKRTILLYLLPKQGALYCSSGTSAAQFCPIPGLPVSVLAFGLGLESPVPHQSQPSAGTSVPSPGHRPPNWGSVSVSSGTVCGLAPNPCVCSVAARARSPTPVTICPRQAGPRANLLGGVAQRSVSYLGERSEAAEAD